MDNCDYRTPRQGAPRHPGQERPCTGKRNVDNDLEADRARGLYVTESEIVVIGREFSSMPSAAMFA